MAVQAERSDPDLEAALAELTSLAAEAGAVVVGAVRQRGMVHAQSYIGLGKAEELRSLAIREGARLVIALDELTPSQVRVLEDALDVRVIDRTEVILAIFARRAQSREGKLQVELAQLTYMLPRLQGQGKHMSRLGGGIGTRGPGESKLETDRRRIRSRLAHMRRELERVKARRQVMREGRAELPLVALVGYTNAGKSSLLRALSADERLRGEERLFATLDPTVRRVRLAGGGEALVSDTVGFVEDLPHTLIAAFRATLEEVAQAQLLLHVVDSQNPRLWAQMQAVRAVLEEIGAQETDELVVFTKTDLGPSPAHLPGSVCVSARRGDGIEDLREAIAARLAGGYLVETFFIPYSRLGATSWLFKHARIEERKDEEGGVRITARLERRWRDKVRAQLR